MASVSVEHCLSYDEILSPFQVFITQVSEELESRSIRPIKLLLTGKVDRSILDNIDPNQDGAVFDLISELQRIRLISPNNLDLLKAILNIIGRCDLAGKVEEFQEKSVTHLDDAGRARMEMIHEQVKELVALYLLLAIKKECLTVNQIDQLKDSIRNVTDLKLEHIVYMFSQPDLTNPINTLVTFHCHDKTGNSITKKLQLSALTKEKWLIENKVVSLKINGYSSINIEENALGIQSVKCRKEESVLKMKPELQPYTRNTVDVVLIIEMTNSAQPFIHGCYDAIKSLKDESVDGEKLDLQIGVITYSYNSSTSSSPATIVQHFSKELSDIKTKLNPTERCASPQEEICGMGNALAEVTKLSGIRPHAAKVCIMTSFLSRTDDLKRFSCPENDIIKLAQTLAEHKIPLYILGVEKAESNPCKMEEYLFRGVSHIGGGRYFNIEKNNMQSNIHQIVKDIVVHEVSIENRGTTTAPIFKDALTSNFGDVNETRLSTQVRDDQRFKPIKELKKLELNRESLQPEDRIVRRVAFATDMSDAVEALKRFFDPQKQDHSDQTRGSALSFRARNSVSLAKQHKPSVEEKLKTVSLNKDDGEEETDKPVRADVAQASSNAQEVVSPEQQAQDDADLELASRIVRRYFYRMAYYKSKP